MLKSIKGLRFSIVFTFIFSSLLASCSLFAQAENDIRFTINWGLSPSQVVAIYGQPETPLLSNKYSALSYPVTVDQNEGLVIFYFHEERLDAALYTFQVPNDENGLALYESLKAVVRNDIFKDKEKEHEWDKNDIKIIQAIWDKDNTIAKLSFIKSASEISLKLIDKNAAANYEEVELINKYRRK